MASTSAEGAIQWSALPVRNSIGPHAVRSQALIQGSEEAVESLGNVAAVLKAAGEEDKLQQLREATAHMLQARETLHLHHQALTHLASPSGYHPTGATTNFEAVLGAKADELAAAQPYDANHDPLMLQFEELAAAGEEQEGAAEEQIDDDIAIEGGGAVELGKNTQCPLTGKPLVELQEPVVDAVGFVYEKATILDWIQRRGGGHAAPCPVAGTAHQVTAVELRPARAVLAAKKKLGAAGGRRVGAGRRDAAQNVVDLE